MEIACLDSSASARLALTHLIDSAIIECRSTVGHMATLRAQPHTREALLLGGHADIIIVGPTYQLDATQRLLEELAQCLPSVPRAVVLSPESYTLRNLQRLKSLAHELFCSEDLPIRIIHGLLSLEVERKSYGKLVSVHGTKGGVGSTSIVSGLAHAAEALGKSSVIVDLSLEKALPQYLLLPKLHSPELSAAMVDQVVPDRLLVKKGICRASNGISVLLPLAGGGEVRELWIRSEAHLDFSLQLIDILKQLYDLVIVDIAGTEGALPSAITSYADSRIIVSSSSPASVHLLQRSLSKLEDISGTGKTSIIINANTPHGLTKRDILSFLRSKPGYSEPMQLSPYLSYDQRGQNWIGTGNSFYTESRRLTQLILDEATSSICKTGIATCSETTTATQGFKSGLKRLTEVLQLSPPKQQPQALPAPDGDWSLFRTTPQFVFDSPIKQPFEGGRI